MRNENVLPVLIAMMIFLTYALIPGEGSTAENASRGSQTKRAPIRIDSDSEFASLASMEGWPGDGSEGDPYVIEDFSIDGMDSGCCLYIGNTTVHFIVRNCTFENASYGPGHRNNPSSKYYGENGITFWMVENGTLENVTCYGNGLDGARLHWDNGTIKACRFHHNGDSGLWYAGDVLDLRGSRFDNNTGNGAWLYGGTHAVISGNLFQDNSRDGLFMFYLTADNSILGNTFIDNARFDINLSSSIRNTIDANIMTSGINIDGYEDEVWLTQVITGTNLLKGHTVRFYRDTMPSEIDYDSYMIMLVNITDVTLKGLSIDSPASPLNIIYCHHVTVSNSSFSGSKGPGIRIGKSDNVTVSNCSFFDNRIGAIIGSYSTVKIEGCEAYDNIETGIEVGVSSMKDVLVVLDNKVWDNGGIGLSVHQSSGEAQCVVEGNEAYGNLVGIDYHSAKGGYWGENVFHTDVVRGNRVHDNDLIGIDMKFMHSQYLTEIKGNAIERNGIGLSIADSSGGGSNVTDNVIEDNRDDGILIALSNGGHIIDGIQTGVLIENNTITGNWGFGLNLSSLRNGGGVPVLRNMITDNGRSGIYCGDASDQGPNTIGFNDISRNGGIGIELLDLANGGDTVIENNTITDNGWTTSHWSEMYPDNDPVGGIFIGKDSSSGYPIRNNTISDNAGTGIYILVSSSGSGNISNNEIEDNDGDGIFIETSRARDRSILNNTIIGNAGSGIEFGLGINGYDVFDNTISGNREGILLNGSNSTNMGRNIITSNGLGILSEWGDNATVRYNNLSDNDGFGVQINNGNHSTIWENSFFGNNEATDAYNEAHRQACDNGTGNKWYYGTTGNYWDDWRSVSEDEIRTDPYPLDCGAGSVDMYPLRDPSSAGPSNVSNYWLKGSILSEEGAPLPGVTVTITELNSGAMMVIVTDNDGNFSKVLRPGPYKIRSSKEGYEPKEVWFEMPSNDEELSIVMAMEDDGGPYLLLCLIGLVPLVLLLLLTAIIALVVVRGRRKRGREE